MKEALYRGEALTVKDALEEFDVTNNYYQKYKNSIIPFYEATNGKIFTLLFVVFAIFFSFLKSLIETLQLSIVVPFILLPINKIFLNLQLFIKRSIKKPSMFI